MQKKEQQQQLHSPSFLKDRQAVMLQMPFWVYWSQFGPCPA